MIFQVESLIIEGVFTKMETQAKSQQKWACLVSEIGPFLKSHWCLFIELGSVLGFTLEQFTDLFVASGFTKCSKKGKLGFSMSVFESAIFSNEDANADVDVVKIPIRHDNLSETKGEFKKQNLACHSPNRMAKLKGIALTVINMLLGLVTRTKKWE